MTKKLHFISGLPRSGSTLLAALLRQNPRFHASISTPLSGLVGGLLKGMSHHEAANLITDQQRRDVLTAVMEGYWRYLAEKEVVFDTGRMWCAVLPTLRELCPESKVVCCVRSPAWIADSIERLVQKNALLVSKLFPKDRDLGNVYTRYDALFKTGLIGASIKNLRQAWFGEAAGMLIVIRYESLAERPGKVMAKLYELIQEPYFQHDFEHVEYEEPEFDERLAIPGLHRVKGRVALKRKRSIPTG